MTTKTLYLDIVALVRVWVLLCSYFSRETNIICCNYDDQDFLLWTEAPVLNLVHMWWLSLRIKTWTPSQYHKLYIICNFRLCSSCFCLCSRFTCRKDFLMRSIVLCLVDNQQSGHVIVVGVCINFGLKPRSWTLSFDQSTLSYLSEDRVSSTSGRTIPRSI